MSVRKQTFVLLLTKEAVINITLEYNRREVGPSFTKPTLLTFNPTKIIQRASMILELILQDLVKLIFDINLFAWNLVNLYLFEIVAKVFATDDSA